MEKNNIYKLTSGKTKGGWQLPLTDILIQKIKDGKNEGLRKIKYVPGTNSFWAEDLHGELKPKQVWFNNGKLVVPKADKLLNELLKIHPFNKKHYKLVDKEKDAQDKLDAFRAKDEVITLIANSEVEKIVATAMAIFGNIALNWTDSTCELELRKYAEKDPTKLTKELNSKTYESKYLSALAFSKRVVMENLTKTAVIWNDSTEGEILKLARGERGITRLGDLLSKKTEESEMILRAIGEKLKLSDVDLSGDEKDDEIARLKEELAEAKGKTNDTLDVIRKKYKEKFDKEVPPRFKNDPEWIEKKLSE